MNKKIKELAEAAGYYHDFDNDGTIVFKNTPGDKGDLELFANLIIKECMKQCQRQWYDENNINTTDMNARDIAIHVGKKSGYIQCINSIKEHFGIK